MYTAFSKVHTNYSTISIVICIVEIQFLAFFFKDIKFTLALIKALLNFANAGSHLSLD